MYRHYVGLVAATFAFMLGLVLGTMRLNPRQVSEPSPPTAAATAPSINCVSTSAEESSFDLVDDNSFHSNLNGWELPLSDEPLADFEISELEFVPLTGGGSLVGVGQSLFMFDAQRRVVWEYDSPNPLIDFDVVETTGLVYGTAGDNIMFILELSSGKELEAIARNGSAAYGQVTAYGRDQCLIKDNFSVYRDKLPPDLEPMKDGLAAWRGTELLWHIDFPPDAELIVRGKKIFALTKTKTRVYLKEVATPNDKELRSS